MKKKLVPLCLFCLHFTLSAQNLDLNKKQLQATRVMEAPQLDGVLDEAIWLNAPFATDFVQQQPNPGQTPSQPTEIKIIYDNTGIYVGAVMYDSHPDSILKELSQRDQLGNTDWFGIFIDAYRDGINGVSFIVTPAGVQFDAKYSTFGEDESWDAVWEGKTKITSEGWVAEMKIPYSAIRFPDRNEQTWHLNFGRMIRRQQQKSFWSEVDPNKNGFLNQAGYLTNIQDIKSPIRLQATPFLAVYAQHYHDRQGDPKNSFGRSFNGGMDIKYGISDAFTLDMTLIPDFGEAQSDNQVLNLSPFEVQFDENRQFFTEGTELFNKGGLFYSRRIGGTPLRYYDVEDHLVDGEEIVSNPDVAQLYNATKISGRNSKGLGIGFFNATEGRRKAVIQNAEGEEREFETSPLTNYNVLVLDQNLKNNSFATLINTTVLRSGPEYDANVTGGVFTIRNKANSYAISGSGAVSQKYFSDKTDLGHAWEIGLRKSSGEWQWGIEYEEESDTYDPNDLGFNSNNNGREFDFWTEYNKYKSFWGFNRGGIGIWTGYERLYSPNVYTEYGVEGWVWAETKNFWNINLFSYHEPFTTYDYFETRTEGRFYRNPKIHNYGFSISSDSRKRFRLQTNSNLTTTNEKGRYNLNASVSGRYRVNDKLNFELEVGRFEAPRSVGFVDKLENTFIDPGTGEPTEQVDVIFGRRDQLTFENIFNTRYNFSANMALSFRLRHYWSKVAYESFHHLDKKGNLAATDYDDTHDRNFNAFTIDMVYRWRFAPGSDVYIVWKNAIFGEEDFVRHGYFKNMNGLFKEPQTNSISLKVIYYLDYLQFAKRKTQMGS
ncbi:MAG: hypothetical protein DHS20C18_04960 [Saprospiraceae bacterium]|nr:MAG: hypothetical protein DHS20C18_04960 [Saprospiraceae bacterium]